MDVIWLVIVAFLEAFILPFPPPDVFLIGLSLENPGLWFLYALISTTLSTLGGGVGVVFGEKINEYLKLDVKKFERLYEDYGALAIAVGAMSPLPFKVVAIGSGLLEFPLDKFIKYAFITRGLRFFAVAYISAYYGKELVDTIINHPLSWFVAIAVGVLLILGKFIKMGSLNELYAQEKKSGKEN